MGRSETIPSTTGSRRSSPRAKQFLAVVVASLAAIAANVILYTVLKDILGVPFIAPEQFPPPWVSPLPVSDVAIFGFIFSAGASIVFLILANTSRKPARDFTLVSLIVLVMSFLLPLRIPTPPVPMVTKLSLVGMHMLGAAVLVPLLIMIGLPKRERRGQ